MTPEAIRAVYNQGPDAVIALVTQLSGLYEVVTQLQEQNAELSARVAALEAQIAKNSHNSSKPPASDGLTKPAPRSLRTPSGKRPGAQKGHPGSSLCWSQTPDQVIEHRPAQCAACGEALLQAQSTALTCRQVHDLPPLRIQVVEHHVYSGCCPVCQHTTRATFPEGVEAPVQYGPQIKALGVYLTCYQLLPFARSSGLLRDLLGVSLSSGTLSSAQTHCAERLAPVQEQIKMALTGSNLVHFDETGVRIAGKLHWLHVACTPQLTHYTAHAKRGRAAAEEIGILPAFRGTAVHDGWASYMSYGCRHGLCNAHHLRELTFLAEEEGLLWAQGMKRLLLDIKEAVDQAKNQAENQAKNADWTGLAPPLISAFEAHYADLLRQGQFAHPLAPATGKQGRAKQSKGHNLLERLRLHRTATLVFMHDFTVPFDNNQAERDVRMMKLRLKISGCFRTQTGAEVFCRIRGYVSTMLKQGNQALAVLTALLEGQTVYPALST